MHNVFLFTDDLRVQDNKALSECCNADQQVLLLYIIDPKIPVGSNQTWWLEQSLADLGNNLQKIGGKLVILKGDTIKTLEKIYSEHSFSRIYYNRSPYPSRRQNESEIKNMCRSKNIECQQFNDDWLIDYNTLMSGTGSYMKVFTPFYKKACVQLKQPGTASKIPKIKNFRIKMPHSTVSVSTKIEKKLLHDLYSPGESGAHRQLSGFLKKIDRYSNERDYPEKDATSHLSPHLRFGEISPHRIINKMQSLKNKSAQVEPYVRQLFWREFARYLIWHFPKLGQNNFRSKFNGFKWSKSKINLEKWQHGQTGFPIVDAGMRELLSTGNMHNRVRMITASFLVKDLLIDWRAGEQWFSEHLMDADEANNALGWQWVAGSGPDSAPYFRIFNPELQSRKFDSTGNYIRKWIPELAHLNSKDIHCPKQSQPDLFSIQDKDSAQSYPKPIVDHKKARIKALERFREL